MCVWEVIVYKSGISAAFFLWLFVIDGLLLEGEAFEGGLELLLALQNLGDELVEGTPGTFECFGAGLDVDDAYLFCDGGGFVLLHFALVVEVVLVADEEQVDFGDIGLLVDLLDPEVDHFEGLVVGDVEDEEYAVDVAVVVGSDSVVAGGSGGVPDLHADGVAVLELEDLLLVLDADGGRVVHAELLVYVLRQQRALTHVALPDDQHLHPHLVLAHTPIIYIETPHRRIQKIRGRRPTIFSNRQPNTSYMLMSFL